MTTTLPRLALAASLPARPDQLTSALSKAVPLGRRNVNAWDDEEEGEPEEDEEEEDDDEEDDEEEEEEVGGDEADEGVVCSGGM